MVKYSVLSNVALGLVYVFLLKYYILYKLTIRLIIRLK